MRILYKIEVKPQGQSQYFFKVVSRDSVKHLTIRCSREGLIKFLKKIQAKDSITNPNSYRGITYIQIADDIISGNNPYIYVWSNMWKPDTNKIKDLGV